MFSLIITIISIALVAVLALATLYYGGDAFNKGTADAQAAKIVNQGQQLLAASELFEADPANAGVVMTIPELVARGYLKSVPVAYQGNASVNEAWAATEWSMPLNGQPLFVAPVDATGACKAVNKRTIGMDGILAKVHDSVITQCYGTSTTALKAVVGKNRAAFAAVDAANPTALPAADIVTDPAPADATSGWLAGYEPSGASAGPVVPPVVSSPFFLFESDQNAPSYPGWTNMGIWLGNSSGTSITIDPGSVTVTSSNTGRFYWDPAAFAADDSLNLCKPSLPVPSLGEAGMACVITGGVVNATDMGTADSVTITVTASGVDGNGNPVSVNDSFIINFSTMSGGGGGGPPIDGGMAE